MTGNKSKQNSKTFVLWLSAVVLLYFSTAAWGASELSNVTNILRALSGNNPLAPVYGVDVNEDNKIGLEEAIYSLQCLAGVRNCPLPDIDISETYKHFKINDPPDWTFQIWNSGETESILNFGVLEGQNWIDCSPQKGTSSGVNDKKTITLSIDRDNLATGNQPGIITVSDPRIGAKSVIITAEKSDVLYVPTDEGIVRISHGGASDIVVNDDGIYSIEVHNEMGDTFIYSLESSREIKVYNSDGVFQKSIPIPPSIPFPTGFNYISRWFYYNNLILYGKVALFDNDGDKIYFIDSSGNLLASRDMLHPPDLHAQNTKGIVVGDFLYISEDGNRNILRVNVNTYEVSIFRNLDTISPWLGAIGYGNGDFYICGPDIIYRFGDRAGPIKVATVPNGNITGIQISWPYAYATINFTGEIYRTDLRSGVTELYANGLDYTDDLAMNKQIPILHATLIEIVNNPDEMTAWVLRNQRSGEMIQVLAEKNGNGDVLRISGGSYILPSGESLVFWLGDDGYPEFIVVEGWVFKFSNYTDTTVYIVAMSPEGIIREFEDVPIATDRISGELNDINTMFSDGITAFPIDTQDLSENLEVIEKSIGVVSKVYSVVACPIGIVTAPSGFGLALAIAGCTSTFLGDHLPKWADPTINTVSCITGHGCAGLNFDVWEKAAAESRDLVEKYKLQQETDKDGDGYTKQQGDCNDNNASIHPGATEICNDGEDNDCDGSADCNDIADCSTHPDCLTCTDADADGYYGQSGCGTDVDCNDNNAQIHPGAPEIIGDGIDQDCSRGDMSVEGINAGLYDGPWGKSGKRITRILPDGGPWCVVAKARTVGRCEWLDEYPDSLIAQIVIGGKLLCDQSTGQCGLNDSEHIFEDICDEHCRTFADRTYSSNEILSPPPSGSWPAGTLISLRVSHVVPCSMGIAQDWTLINIWSIYDIFNDISLYEGRDCWDPSLPCAE